MAVRHTHAATLIQPVAKLMAGAVPLPADDGDPVVLAARGRGGGQELSEATQRGPGCTDRRR